MIRAAPFAAALTLGLLIYFGTPLLMEAWANQSDRPRIITGVLGILAAVLTALFALWRWSFQHRADQKLEEDRRDADKKLESDRRRRRRLRILIALRAELGLNARAHYAWFAPGPAAERKAIFLDEMNSAEDGEHSMPMAVVSQTNDVFDNIKDEIADLPEEVIAPVIAYYQQDEYIVQMLGRFSEGTFEKVSPVRRERAIVALFSIGRAALESALSAFKAVDQSLDKAGAPVSQDMLAVREEIVRIRQELAQPAAINVSSEEDTPGSSNAN